MRWQTLSIAVLGCGALLSAGSALAQWGSSGSHPDDRANYFAQDGRRDRGGLIDRVVSDLDRARSYHFADHHTRKDFDKTRDNLLRFQDRRAQGHFDTGKLDEAIEQMNHLVRAPELSRRDRETLMRDLRALRDFRANGGRPGYRGR